MVGLGNVDNTTDANKPVSSATQTALDLKSPLASPTFTGIPAAPTATAGNSSTQVATTAFVTNAVSAATSGTFVDLTTTQTVAGAKTFSSDITVNGVKIGSGAGNVSTNTAVGRDALIANTMGSYNTSIGDKSQNQSSMGFYNTAIGANAMDRLIAGNNNVVLGGNAGRYFGVGTSNNNTDMTNGILIGYDTRPLADEGSNEIVIGPNAIGNGSNTTTIGGASTTDTYLKGNVHVSNALKISGGTPGVGKVLTSDANGLASWTTPSTTATAYSGILPVANGGTGAATLTGYIKGTGASAMTASASIPVADVLGAAPLDSPTFTGTPAAPTATAGTNTTQVATTEFVTSAVSSGVPYTGANAAVNLGSYDLRVQGLTVGLGTGSNSNNTAFGSLALASNHPTAEKNSAIGKFALNSNSTGLNNTGLGYFAGKSNIVGSNNTSIGAFAMENSTGSDNTAIGSEAMKNTTSGSDNTAIGKNSLSTNVSGNKNTVLGSTADVASGGLSNATAIGYGAIASANNTIQLGNASITNVKTNGTITAGVITYPKTAGSSMQVLTTNGTGTASWLFVDAGTLTGPTLKSTVTGSSLTSVGTLTSATINGKVVVGASSEASSSAILEASSTTQGFLPPRMTYVQREAITSPATGLVVFCTNCGPASIGGELEVYSGGMWRNMTGTAAATGLVNIGDSYQGGKVAYILQSGDPGYDPSVQHGLIAATSDQSSGIRWNNVSQINTGATGTAIGTGLSNTNTIINSQGATATSYAAGLARAYNGGGYTDWYLPSIDEIYKLYLNKTAIGGFMNVYYWSSTETNNINAWAQSFDVADDGSQFDGASKNGPLRVRAIRAF